MTFVLVLLLSGTVEASPRSLVFGMHDGDEAYASVSVLKKAYAKHGITVMGKTQKPGRGLIEANQGHLDGDIYRIDGIENEYPNLIKIPVPIHKIEGVAFVCRDDITINGWESLQGYRIGHQIGIIFSKNGLKGIKNVTQLPHLDNLFDLLQAGRIDIVIAARNELAPQKKRLGSKTLHALEPPLEVMSLFHYLHKKHANIVPNITRTLQQMHDRGELVRIRNETMQKLRERPSM